MVAAWLPPEASEAHMTGLLKVLKNNGMLARSSSGQVRPEQRILHNCLVSFYLHIALELKSVAILCSDAAASLPDEQLSPPFSAWPI